MENVDKTWNVSVGNDPHWFSSTYRDRKQSAVGDNWDNSCHFCSTSSSTSVSVAVCTGRTWTGVCQRVVLVGCHKSFSPPFILFFFYISFFFWLFYWLHLKATLSPGFVCPIFNRLLSPALCWDYAKIPPSPPVSPPPPPPIGQLANLPVCVGVCVPARWIT